MILRGPFRPQLLQQQAQSTAADLKRTNVRCAKARRVCQHVWTVLGQMSTAKNEAAKSWKRSVGSAKMWYTAKPSNYSWKDTMGFKQCSVSLCKPFSFKYSSPQLLDLGPYVAWLVSMLGIPQWWQWPKLHRSLNSPPIQVHQFIAISNMSSGQSALV